MCECVWHQKNGKKETGARAPGEKSFCLSLFTNEINEIRSIGGIAIHKVTTELTDSADKKREKSPCPVESI